MEQEVFWIRANLVDTLVAERMGETRGCQWLVEGNCFWFCHTCGSRFFSRIFCSSSNQQFDRQVSHLSLPRNPRARSGNFHGHNISYLSKNPLQSRYATNEIRCVYLLKHKSEPCRARYNYCAVARYWNSRIEKIAWNHYTSIYYIYVLVYELLRA